MRRARGEGPERSRAAELQSAILRGRKAVRADHRLRTDDEAIRTQSAILDKNLQQCFLFLSITLFFARMVSIRAKNRVGARSAQCQLEVCVGS